MQELVLFKRKIIASISHKLRTPVNCASGMLQLIISELGGQDLMIKKYINPIMNNNIILSSYIDDICDYVEIEMGNFFLDLSNFDFK